VDGVRLFFYVFIFYFKRCVTRVVPFCIVHALFYFIFRVGWGDRVYAFNLQVK
jgi:hypothetical protein